MYINKLDDIVNKYKNKYHRTIKMKSVDVKSSTYIDSSKDNLKLVIPLEYENIKHFLRKGMFENGPKKYL